MNKNTILIAVAAAVALFGLTAGRKGSVPSGLGHRAFVTYEAEWRKVNGQAADKLSSGDLKSESDARDWIEAQQKDIRRKAFGDIAAFEQKQLGNGQWTAEKHYKILKGWADGQ